MKKPIKIKIGRDDRRIRRRKQIENLIGKKYFSRPKRAFTTKRIIWGNIDKVPKETLKRIYKIMLARIKTKQALRDKLKEEKAEADTTLEKKRKANQRIGRRIMEKTTATNLTDPKALERHVDFLEQQKKKLAKIETGTKSQMEKIINSAKKTRKSRRIFDEKGKGDTVIINLGGVPIAFRITRQNLTEIENRIWPQTKLDPVKIAIRKILMQHPKRKVVTIIKNLKAQGLTANEGTVNKVLIEMIDEKLIGRGYPLLPNKK